MVQWHRDSKEWWNSGTVAQCHRDSKKWWNSGTVAQCDKYSKVEQWHTATVTVKSGGTVDSGTVSQ